MGIPPRGGVTSVLQRWRVPLGRAVRGSQDGGLSWPHRRAGGVLHPTSGDADHAEDSGGEGRLGSRLLPAPHHAADEGHVGLGPLRGGAYHRQGCGDDSA